MKRIISFNLFSLSLFLTSMILLGSCFTMNNLVEAEGLGKANHSLQLQSELITVSENENLGLWPTLGMMYGYGITDKFDLRVEGNTNRSMRINGKYTLIDKEKYDLAAGATLDSDLFFARSVHPSLQLYNTFHLGRLDIMINPSAELTSNIYFTDGSQYGMFYSLATGISTGHKNPLKFGFNVGWGPKVEGPILFSMGLAYEFKWLKQ